MNNFFRDKIQINKEDINDAQITSSSFSDIDVQKRAFLNVLGAKIAMNEFFAKKIDVNNFYSLYTINSIREKLDIADIYYQNIKIDVRVIFNENEIFVPKSHEEINIEPDVYLFIKLDTNTFDDAEILGYITPEEIDKTQENKTYYFVNYEQIRKIENVNFISEIKHKDRKGQELLTIDKVKELFVKLIDKQIDDKEFKELVYSLSCDIELRKPLAEFENFEFLANNTSRSQVIKEDGVLNVVGAQDIFQNEEEETLEEAMSEDAVITSDDAIKQIYDEISEDKAEKDDNISITDALPALTDTLAFEENLKTDAAILTGDLLSLSDSVEEKETTSNKENENDDAEEILSIDISNDKTDNTLLNTLDENSEDSESNEIVALDDILENTETENDLSIDTSNDEADNILLDTLDENLKDNESNETVALNDAQENAEEDENFEMGDIEDLFNDIEENSTETTEENITEENESVNNNNIEETQNETEQENKDDITNNEDFSLSLNADTDYLPELVELKPLSLFEEDEEENEQSQPTIKNTAYDTDSSTPLELPSSSNTDIMYDIFGNKIGESEETTNTEEALPSIQENNNEVENIDTKTEELNQENTFENETLGDINNLNIDDSDVINTDDEKDILPEDSNDLPSEEDDITNENSQDSVDDYEMGSLDDLDLFDNMPEEEASQENETTQDNETSTEEDSDSIDEDLIESLLSEETNEKEETKNALVVSDKEINSSENIENTDEQKENSAPVELDDVVNDAVNNDGQKKNVLKMLFTSRKKEAKNNNKEQENQIPSSQPSGIPENAILITAKNFVLMTSSICLLFTALIALGTFVGIKLSDSVKTKVPETLPEATNTQKAPQETPNLEKIQETQNTSIEPINAKVSNVSWEVPESLAYNDILREYLQLAGKNIKLNLQNELLLTTEYVYSSKTVVDLRISKSGDILSTNVSTSSGSKTIDEIITKTVDETLKYLKVPTSELIDNETVLSLVISF